MVCTLRGAENELELGRGEKRTQCDVECSPSSLKEEEEEGEEKERKD